MVQGNSQSKPELRKQALEAGRKHRAGVRRWRKLLRSGREGMRRSMRASLEELAADGALAAREREVLASVVELLTKSDEGHPERCLEEVRRLLAAATGSPKVDPRTLAIVSIAEDSLATGLRDVRGATIAGGAGPEGALGSAEASWWFDSARGLLGAIEGAKFAHRMKLSSSKATAVILLMAESFSAR